MNFRDDDIESSLGFTGQHQLGRYNQLQWYVSTGNDATDIVTRFMSIHEFLHNELNNLTGFGSILTVYAYLSKEDIPNKGEYKELLDQLVKRCKTPHESYATWIGISVFKKTMNDSINEQILNDNKEYEYYYHCAENLVKNLAGLFLKHQVVAASIRFCFQSTNLVNSVINNLKKFNIATISNEEFPDSRFRYLMERLPENFLVKCVEDFIIKTENTIEHGLLTDAINGNENMDELIDIKNNHIALGLTNHVYDSLNLHFKERGFPSLQDKEHLICLEKLIKQADAIAPLNQSKTPLFINQNPEDDDRNVILNFENETLLFSNHPLPCIIWNPEELEIEAKEKLLKGIGESPHLFITGRHTHSFKGQYTFKYKEDKEWFENMNSPFTAIRCATTFDGERNIIYLPFNEPSILIEFLNEKLTDVPVLACVSISASYHNNWWQQWGGFFVQHCNVVFLLTDISPLYYIEKVFPDEENISYAKMIIKIQDIRYAAMAFRIMAHNIIKGIMIFPCTDMYCQVIHHYIKTRYQKYNNDLDLNEPLYKDLPTILSHIIREEHSYYFHSEN